MKYAIINAAGKQYQVQTGQDVVVDHQEGEPGDKLVFDQVLLLVNDDQRTIGEPLVKGSKVEAKIVEHLKGPKIRVAKFKAKARYRRVQGHRQSQTKVQITKIS